MWQIYLRLERSNMMIPLIDQIDVNHAISSSTHVSSL